MSGCNGCQVSKLLAKDGRNGEIYIASALEKVEDELNNYVVVISKDGGNGVGNPSAWAPQWLG